MSIHIALMAGFIHSRSASEPAKCRRYITEEKSCQPFMAAHLPRGEIYFRRIFAMVIREVLSGKRLILLSAFLDIFILKLLLSRRGASRIWGDDIIAVSSYLFITQPFSTQIITRHFISLWARHRLIFIIRLGSRLIRVNISMVVIILLMPRD